LPEDQAAVVKAYKGCGHLVAFVGHDADDLLALEEADVAITFSSGADVARYRADIVLSADDLSDLVESIEIARSGMALARQNIVVVSVPNLFGLALSLTDQSNILRATLLNNGSVIVGTINGLRPLFTQDKHVITESGSAISATQC
jgi:P-type E1-E2 ATPase